MLPCEEKSRPFETFNSHGNQGNWYKQLFQMLTDGRQFDEINKSLEHVFSSSLWNLG